MSKRLSILIVLIVVIAAGIVIATQLLPKLAPGAAPAATSSGDPGDALAAYAECMRDNGIADFPEPNGGELLLNTNKIDVDSPAFQAAQNTCKSLLPPPPSGSGAEGDSEWEKVVPGGDCMCADGSEYAFFERQADPTKVVFYLDGGGICFDAESCANANTPNSGERAGPDYDPSIEGENPGSEGGMFDLDNEDNPFRDYSFIYVPLCTADSHLGNATHEYSPELTVEHKGFVNGTAALAYLAEHYPDATQIVVVGKTAGSVASPIYGGLIADQLPDAQITVFGAQSGAFPDDPDLIANMLDVWGVIDNLPVWEVNEGITARDWSTRQFWIQAGLHKPDMVMARFDYAFDPHTAEGLTYLLGRDITASELLAIMDANEAAIEAAGVVMHSYTPPGEGHGILEFQAFYDMEANGVRLVDWLEALLAGEPLDDVHCTECEAQ